MRTAALVAWLLTVAGGLTMLTIWIAKGGLRQTDLEGPARPLGAAEAAAPARTNLAHWMVASHVLLALATLGIFGWYLGAREDLQTGAERAPWIVLGLLLVVAGLGATMAHRWSADRKRRRQGDPDARRNRAADQSIPALLVHGHGLFAVATIVLVLLVALDLGT